MNPTNNPYQPPNPPENEQPQIEMKPEPPQQRIEVHDHGDVKIMAVFYSRNGKEMPYASAAVIETPDNRVTVEGKNSLATAYILAEHLSRNIIHD